MGRAKIEIEPITNQSKRNTTEKSRQFGLFKKAGQLAKLTGTNVFLFTQTNDGVISTFTSKDDTLGHMNDIYQKITSNDPDTCVQIYKPDNILEVFKNRNIVYRHPKKGGGNRKKRIKAEVSHTAQNKTIHPYESMQQDNALNQDAMHHAMEGEFRELEQLLNIGGGPYYANHVLSGSIYDGLNVDGMPPDEFNKMWEEMAKNANFDLGEDCQNIHSSGGQFSSSTIVPSENTNKNLQLLEKVIENTIPSTFIQNMSVATNEPYTRDLNRRYAVDVQKMEHGGLRVQTTRTVSIQDSFIIAEENIKMDWDKTFKQIAHFASTDLKLNSNKTHK